MSQPASVYPSPATLADQARELLDRLGGNAKDVAAGLATLGITGRREDCETCPIAVYLMRSDLGLSSALVSEDHISLYAVASKHVGWLSTPQPVREFILGFDRGGYQQLVKGGTR